MITAVAALFARPAIKYGAIALVVVLLFALGWWAYSSAIDKGVAAGKADVTNQVQSKTIEATEKARQTKEQADEEVRSTPYPARVDGLR